jgi:hypothetical protein
MTPVKTPNICPFELYPHDVGRSVMNHKLAEKLWLKAPNEGRVSWYALGLVVTGPTTCKVQVYGMLDNVYGGVGRKVKTYTPPSLTAEEQNELKQIIKDRQTLYAGEEFERREKAKRKADIEVIRKELFGKGAAK